MAKRKKPDFSKPKPIVSKSKKSLQKNLDSFDTLLEENKNEESTDQHFGLENKMVSTVFKKNNYNNEHRYNQIKSIMYEPFASCIAF